MSSCPLLNCTHALRVPPPLKPNSDISGIGVLIKFFTTAHLALILLIIHYILVFGPREAVLNFIAKWVDRPRKRWEKGLEKMVLMMGDQQMIMGIALLFSATSQLNCGISAYHWQITIYLVWFSSFTHLTTLTFLRDYLYENSLIRWWRLFFMTAIVALLVAALIPTGNGRWLPSGQPRMAGTPAICLFHYRSTGPDVVALTSMLFSILVLCISYTTRAIMLFERSSKVRRLALRTMPGNAIKRHLQKLYSDSQNAESRNWRFSIQYHIILSVLLVIRSWLDLLQSMLWEITWLLVALLWGTLRLFATRNAIIDQENILEENSWGFGQCLATAMLVLLLFLGIETYMETKRLDRIDPSSLTNLDSISSSTDINGIEESVVVQPPLTESSNNNLASPGNFSIDPTGLGDADIADQAKVATGTDEQLRGIIRSPTTLSWEKRSLEPSSHRRYPIQHPNDGIELEEISHATPAAPAPTIEPQDPPPPHKRNYYDDRWYTVLGFFNFYQIIGLSSGILTGAYNTDVQGFEFPGVFGSARHVGTILLKLLKWIFVYTPLSCLMITVPCVWLTETYTKWRRWLHAACRHLGFGQSSYGPGDIFLLVIAGSFTGFILFSQFLLIWEGHVPFGKRFLVVWVYSILVIVYVPWSWFISWELKKERKKAKFRLDQRAMAF